jgi:hypothetical protein
VFHTTATAMTMASAGPIRRENTPNGVSSGFSRSHRYAPSVDVPRAVSSRRHGCRNRRRIRYKEELLHAYHEVYEWLSVRGFKPLLHKMDNETSHEVEKFIQGQQTRLQYTPPDMHRTNPAERAIHTSKNHFLTGIAGLPKSFPFANWCRLTKQCDATLNMLRPCHQNPLLSAHEALEGSFSFNATPMAPLGTEVLVHMKPNQGSTWGYHASKAWYLSHSPNHYRCIRVLMADTGGERITDTFRFNHHSIPVPKITATNRILDATARLTVAIEGVQEAPPVIGHGILAGTYLAEYRDSLK